MTLILSSLRHRLRRLSAIMAATLFLPAAAAAQSLELSNYAIKCLDVIDIRVFEEEDLSLRVMVNRDGSVRLPLVGSLQVAGLTTDQTAGQIRTALAGDYLINPQVTVAVAQFAKRRVTVLGQVARPGPIEIRPGERLAILQAIGEAGGFTRLANPKNVIVKRSAGGREVTFLLNVKQMAVNAQAAPFYLEAGDVITVKESLF